MKIFPLKIGITGSIGMGKTTVASEIAKYNYPVWYTDNIVHELYKKGNSGYHVIKSIAPDAILNNAVDREILSDIVVRQPIILETIQKHLYPILKVERTRFISENKKKKLIVFDIPLLFETNSHEWLDIVIVVTAPFTIQKRRVLNRKSMTEAKFKYLLSKQLSDKEKKQKADYILDTNCDIPTLTLKVREIMKTILNVNH